MKSMAIKLLMLGMLLTAAAGAGIGMATHRIEHIEVYGAPEATENKIINLLSRFADRSVLLFPVSRASNLLFEYLPLKKVRMAVRWPDTLVVNVSFRQSQLWMLTQVGVFGLDDEGFRLEPPAPDSEIPVLVEGCAFDQTQRATQCSRKASAMFRLLQLYQVDTTKIGSILIENDRISLLMSGPLRIRFGDDSSLSKKIRQMKKVLSWFSKRRLALRRLDLMDPEHPVARLAVDLIG